MIPGTEPAVVRTVAAMSPYELVQIFRTEEYTSVRVSVGVYLKPVVSDHTWDGERYSCLQ